MLMADYPPGYIQDLQFHALFRRGGVLYPALLTVLVAYCSQSVPRRAGGYGFSFTICRRRVNTEEKAKVVAAVWGTEFIQFLSALAVLH